MKRKIRILSFDGGGIRGALTARILSRLNQKYPEFYKQTYLFAGTSTGSLIALGLATGNSPEDIVELYRSSGVFKQKRRNLFKPKYSNENLRKTLLRVFSPELTLEQLSYKVVIPAFRLKTPGVNGEVWSPVFFNNLDIVEEQERSEDINEVDELDYSSEYFDYIKEFVNPDSGKERVIDVALCSSAAPTYFPAYNNCIDGGVVANNPALIAIALVGWGKVGKRRYLLFREEKDVCVFSLGTGFLPQKIDDASDWGLYQWGLGRNFQMPLLDIIMGGVVEAYDMIGFQMLRDRYWRLNPRLKEKIKLDEESAVEKLIQIADNINLDKTCVWLEKHWLV